MSLRDDLISINDSLSSTLHGINSILPFEVENLKNTPPVIEEAIGSARREGEESGYSNGYNEGRENAETIIVDISNEAIEKYTEPAEDWSELPSKIDEVYEAGKAAGGGGDDYYDTFWDAFQQNGTRHSYLTGFAGHGWTDETFKPKYSMAPTKAGSMFTYSHILDVKGALERQGVTLDTSQATSISSMFQECAVKYVPTISTVSCTACQNIFAHSGSLRSVDALIVREESGQNFSNAFLNCYELKEIRIVGQFFSNISFLQSTKLSKESIESIYASLTTDGGASANTLTLSRTAVNKAFETSGGANDGSTSTEWQNLVSSTPWRTVLS